MRFHYRPKLLIVDDNTILLLGLRFALKQDFQVLTANSGQEGLERANRFIPQVVITDFELGAMNGLELAERLLERFPALPILLYSSALTPELAQRAKAIGIKEVMEKPFEMEELVTRIAKMI